MAKGISASTDKLLEKLKKGYSSKNISPKSSEGAAKKPVYKDSGYASMAGNVLEDYLNREDFSYDVNTDKFYSQYADKYKKAGRSAMKDTVSKASALTGGYANSYAVNAGNQAYRDYLDELNDILPELEAQAYQRYLDKGKDSEKKVDMLLELDSSEYEKHRDSMEDYFKDRDFYEDNYRYRENADMDMYNALYDYILGLAELENSDYYKDQDLMLAYDKLMSEAKQEAYDRDIALRELALKEQQRLDEIAYNQAKILADKEKRASENALELYKFRNS